MWVTSDPMVAKGLNATGQRLASELCDYPINIHYKIKLQIE